MCLFCGYLSVFSDISSDLPLVSSHVHFIIQSLSGMLYFSVHIFHFQLLFPVALFP